MELRYVETFLKIAEYRSFSRAAEKLGYTQSAVTMQMKQLEGELGARLFDRVPRGALLTEAGRTFAFHAQELMAAAERARASVRQGADVAGGLSGTLRIGSVESVATAVLPEVLAAFHERHPRVELVVRTARKELLVEGLRDNSLDVFLTMERQLSVRGAERTLLREEPIVFAAAPGLASRYDGLALADVPGLPLVLTERGESYRYELECLVAEGDGQLRPIVETGNTETLVHLAERGVGVAFLPRFSVRAALDAGALVELPVVMPPLNMWIQRFVHRSKRMTPALAAFIELVDAVLGDVTPGDAARGSVGFGDATSGGADDESADDLAACRRCCCVRARRA